MTDVRARRGGTQGGRGDSPGDVWMLGAVAARAGGRWRKVGRRQGKGLKVCGGGWYILGTGHGVP